VASGDSEAESALIAHLTPRVRVLVLARTRDADLARDLAQESLLAILQAARKDQIRDHSRITAFVCGVARNIINNHVRRTLKHPESPLDEEMLLTAPSTEAADRDEQRRLMTKALAALSAPDRQVLVMTLVEGLKPGEIAERIGASAEVVRTRKSRAIKRLLEELGLPSRNAPARHLL
jgi:RNA polymerase sigma-70 factor (ECF subfamily)